MIYSHALHHLPVDSLRGHTRLVLTMHSEIMLNLLTQMKHTKDHLIKIVLLQMPGLVEQATVAERMEEECSLQLIRSNATTLWERKQSLMSLMTIKSIHCLQNVDDSLIKSLLHDSFSPAEKNFLGNTSLLWHQTNHHLAGRDQNMGCAKILNCKLLVDAGGCEQALHALRYLAHCVPKVITLFPGQQIMPPLKLSLLTYTFTSI